MDVTELGIAVTWTRKPQKINLCMEKQSLNQVRAPLFNNEIIAWGTFICNIFQCDIYSCALLLSMLPQHLQIILGPPKTLPLKQTVTSLMPQKQIQFHIQQGDFRSNFNISSVSITYIFFLPQILFQWFHKALGKVPDECQDTQKNLRACLWLQPEDARCID